MQKTLLRIIGMTCSSCEVRVERKWKTIPGIIKVQVNHATGKALVTHTDELDLVKLQEVLAQDGYQVVPWHTPKAEAEEMVYKNDWVDYVNIAGIFVTLWIIYTIFKNLGLIPNVGLNGEISYILVLGIGLVAALSSCMAVTGGLLLAVSSAWNERHPELSDWQKFKPHLYFNAGRLVFYGILGAAVGALGSALSPSQRFNAIVLLIAGIAMLLLGFQLLHIFPWLKVLMPKMPKGLAHKIHDFESHDHPAAPFLLGGATFFLPCGFTQSLQLYVLSQGDWKRGALTMFIFALGTLPALLSISAISSFLKGAVRHYFFRVAGALVVMIAVLNLKSGLVLAGVNVNVRDWLRDVTTVTNVEEVNGKQVARMSVNGLTYTPATFVVKKGVPVEWIIDASGAAGCSRFISAPKLRIYEMLPAEKPKIFAFTPTETGNINFTCPMGMTNLGTFKVIDPKS